MARSRRPNAETVLMAVSFAGIVALLLLWKSQSQ